MMDPILKWFCNFQKSKIFTPNLDSLVEKTQKKKCQIVASDLCFLFQIGHQVHSGSKIDLSSWREEKSINEDASQKRKFRRVV